MNVLTAPTVLSVMLHYEGVNLYMQLQSSASQLIIRGFLSNFVHPEYLIDSVSVVSALDFFSVQICMLIIDVKNFWFEMT